MCEYVRVCFLCCVNTWKSKKLAWISKRENQIFLLLECVNLPTYLHQYNYIRKYSHFPLRFPRLPKYSVLRGCLKFEKVLCEIRMEYFIAWKFRGHFNFVVFLPKIAFRGILISRFKPKCEFRGPGEKVYFAAF